MKEKDLNGNSGLRRLGLYLLVKGARLIHVKAKISYTRRIYISGIFLKCLFNWIYHLDAVDILKVTNRKQKQTKNLIYVC